MNTWTMRLIGIVVALGITIASFLAWGSFGGAFVRAMDIVYATPAPKPKPANDGVFTVNVLPAPHDCHRDKPCPK
ncbi:MAG TPA: hypothetical protein VHU87_12615 [Rhizomicrobium sp.]|jgi:hypothetical protein|nr:hypothetical protein [Rhizomicrobium sp.]